MKSLLREAREHLVGAKAGVCLNRAQLITEAYRRHEKEPVALKRALALTHVLHHMDLDVTSNPVFAGNTSSRPGACMLLPEYGFGLDEQVLVENDGMDRLLEGAIPKELADYWSQRSFGGNAGIGHLAVDMNRVVHDGLEAILADCDRYRDETDPEKQVYRQAMAVALQGVIDWSGRYARAAEEAANAESDAVKRAAHLRVAEACRRVPARPARDLFEGLQAMVLVHLATAIEGHGMSISIGLPDRVLAPFIDECDSREDVTELLVAFMLKVAGNSVYGRGSKTQAITVGGADHRGEDCCNELTSCMLSACDAARLGDPHLFLRWHPKIDPAVMREALEMLSNGLSMPLLVNDVPTAQGFIDAGVTPEDAWAYCVIGCNELGIPGRSAESATARGGTIQYLELLNETILEQSESDRTQDMSGLLSDLERRMSRKAFEMRRNGIRHKQRQVAGVPTPFTSSLMHDCVRRGTDLLVGMDYHLPGTFERGLTNAANALSAIEQVVFRERAVSMSELRDQMASDFGDAKYRERLRGAPKWGNDDDRVDRWALELVKMRKRVLDEVDAHFEDGPHMSIHVVRSLHHLDGRRIGATPDGRRAMTPVADSIGAETGTAVAGPTALLKSVLKIDAARFFRGGYNLNLTLSSAQTRPEFLRSLVEAFFAEGGQELQINCFDAATLRTAQKNPQEYGDLIVRFSGFSARFVDLSVVEQEELIGRAEAASCD